MIRTKAGQGVFFFFFIKRETKSQSTGNFAEINPCNLLEYNLNLKYENWYFWKRDFYQTMIISGCFDWNVTMYDEK